MKILQLLALCLVLFWCSTALAQSTGTSFATPNGQIAGSAMMLVPCGPITNGQPTACPPGQTNGVPVLCTNCSPSAPTGSASNTVNGTVAVTNTFQSVIVQNSSRKGCTFQNQGSHTMYFSLQGSPTEAGSFQVPPGAAYTCVTPGSNIVSTDQVWVTGTSGDAFAGTWQ